MDSMATKSELVWLSYAQLNLNDFFCCKLRGMLVGSFYTSKQHGWPLWPSPHPPNCIDTRPFCVITSLQERWLGASTWVGNSEGRSWPAPCPPNRSTLNIFVWLQLYKKVGRELLYWRAVWMTALGQHPARPVIGPTTFLCGCEQAETLAKNFYTDKQHGWPLLANTPPSQSLDPRSFYIGATLQKRWP